MPNFTSALYLGMTHASDSLRPWSSLTTGVPAALREPAEAVRVSARIASLVGSARATLAPSTLHLFVDLFAAVAPPDAAIYVDAATYPTARWGLELAEARGASITTLRHFDPEALATAIARDGRRPVLVTDGFCTGCGRVAPIEAWRERLRASGGVLVVDDTQALGVLGSGPSVTEAYGLGGGGAIRHVGAEGSDVVWGASLAKGLGVPIAALAGSAKLIDRFVTRSETRVHCSPPSAASLGAAERALTVNAVEGDRRRRRLLALVKRFRSQLADVGFRARGGLFPVQALAHSEPKRLHLRLLDRGVQTVLRRSACGKRAEVTFVFNASLRAHDVDRAVETLGSLSGR